MLVLQTLHHVLVENDATVPLRIFYFYFLQMLGAYKQHIRPIRNVLSSWRQLKTQNVVDKYILQVVPTAICREIWRSGCTCKYGDKSSLRKD